MKLDVSPYSEKMQDLGHEVGRFIARNRGMKTDLTSTFLLAAGAFGLGALTMYIFDPQQGRRRRAMARDKLVHVQHEVTDWASGTARGLGNRAQGVAAQARGVVREQLERAQAPAGVPESAQQLGR